MKKKITMSDIARAAGTSTVTVSRALSGKEGVGPDLRKKILQAAADVGYQPKTSAAAGGTTVGILLSCRFIGKGQSFYWNLYERVLDSLSEYDSFGILEPIKLADEDAVNLPRLVSSGRVQALLLIGQLKRPYLQALRAEGLQMVQLDAYFAGTGLDAVISDGYHGMYAMTDYVLRRGHRRIAYVGLLGATSSITDRYFGYCRALQEWGIPLRQDWIIPDRKEYEKFLIPLPEEMPTAFVCNCDATAYHLIQRLGERGLRVPEDISVVGFDGYAPFPISSMLTTYAVDMDGMAQAGTAQLMARLSAPGQPPELRIIPGRLTERRSVQTIRDTGVPDS